MRKLWATLCMLYCMGMARTFGRYVISHGGPNQPNCAEYEWRGKRWWVPTEHIL